MTVNLSPALPVRVSWFLKRSGASFVNRTSAPFGKIVSAKEEDVSAEQETAIIAENAWMVLMVGIFCFLYGRDLLDIATDLLESRALSTNCKIRFYAKPGESFALGRPSRLLKDGSHLFPASPSVQNDSLRAVEGGDTLSDWLGEVPFGLAQRSRALSADAVDSSANRGFRRHMLDKTVFRHDAQTWEAEGSGPEFRISNCTPADFQKSARVVVRNSEAAIKIPVAMRPVALDADETEFPRHVREKWSFITRAE